MSYLLTAFPKPRRFPLSPKHRPIRPQLHTQTHQASLPTRWHMGLAARVVDGEAIGGPRDVPYTLESLKQFIIKKHQANNVEVTQNLETDCRYPTIDCTWTSKPRLGQKNRAYLAAHGIQV